MRKWQLLTAPMLAPLLVACVTVGPEYQALDNTKEFAFLERQVEKTEGVDWKATEKNWWKQFNDPALNQLVDQALQDNITLASAEARVRALQSILGDVSDDLYPKGAVSLDYEAGKALIAPEYNQRVKTERFETGIGLTQPLDFFGRIQRSIEAARANAQAEVESLRAVQVEIVAEVVSTYGDLRAAQQRLRVAEENLQNLAEVVRLTKAKFDAGTGSELDLARINSLYAGNQAALPPLRNRVNAAARRLEVLTGQVPGTLDALELAGTMPRVNTALQVGEVGKLLLRRPDLLQAERQVAAATARIGIAEAELYPRVEVNGFLGFFSATGADLIKSDSKAWSLTPTLTWQVFDMASIRNRIDTAEANLEGDLARYRLQLLSALEQTQTAFFNYGEQQQRLRHLLDRQKASIKAQTLAQAQYSEGVIELLDVLDTERTRLAAEDAVVQAENAVYRGIVNIYRNLGGGWEAPSTQVATNKGEPLRQG